MDYWQEDDLEKDEIPANHDVSVIKYSPVWPRHADDCPCWLCKAASGRQEDKSDN